MNLSKHVNLIINLNFQPEYGWNIDIEDLKLQIDDNTAAIIINNPSNPCGSVFSRDHLCDVLDVAAKYHVPIIADEIYEHMVLYFFFTAALSFILIIMLN